MSHFIAIEGAPIRAVGMTEDESYTFQLWLDRNPYFFDRMIFNYRVGGPIAPLPGVDPLGQSAAKVLLPRRIDVVGFQGNVPWIVEVKWRATAAGVGQIITYDALYRYQEKFTGKIERIYVTRQIDDDLLRVCSLSGVMVAVV